jgi:hypothetical protein
MTLRTIAAGVAVLLGAQCSPPPEGSAFPPSNLTENATVQVTTPRYTLSLSPEWQEEAPSDPDRRAFVSHDRNAGLIVSSVGMNASLADTERVARQMIAFRLEAENQAAHEFGLRMTIAEPIVVERPWGRAIAYYGSDSNGRQFSYSGAVTADQVLSVYVESTTLSEQQVKAALDEVLAGLEFDKTRR